MRPPASCTAEVTIRCRFVSRAVGQNWVFEANERHPEELGGRPFLDRLVYRAIPETTSLLTELQTGALDDLLGQGCPGAIVTGEKGQPLPRMLDRDPRQQVQVIIYNGRVNWH